ncbi:hypothetical protein HJD18_07370 [Thermoleophilia bacterium SCSIO 60948]|nr:hypothetical protein HJD18_07370 [Thermoleophilia bacterium SCSIO 60948]
MGTGLLSVASIGSVYERFILDTGRQPEFLFFVAFLATFGICRTVTHAIRSDAKWFPGGDVSVGGTHIHHMVWGILTILITGWIAISFEPPSPWHDLLAVAFGIGAGLTMDEFALWLHLEDVYWSEKGRQSVDAVIVCAAISGLMLISFSAWVEVGRGVADAAFATIGFVGVGGIVLALINAAKEKFATALIGLVISPIALWGAFRLGRPSSLWARRFYGEKRMAKSRRRFGVPEPGPSEIADPATAQEPAGSAAGSTP